MSAILRQFIKRGAVLIVKQQKSNFCSIMLCPQRILGKNKPLVSIVSRSLVSDIKKEKASEKKGKDSEAVEPKPSIRDMKPKIARSVYDKLVRSNKVVVFMKGTPKSPRCGFSNAVVQIFRMHGVEYDAHDVLANDDVREGIKEYTDWPTIPQVFINGEFVGGCDILLEMHQSGELVEELQKVGIISQLLRMEREIADKEAHAPKTNKNDHKKQ